MSWLKKNLKSILLVASLVLNALGGTGVIPPVVAQHGNTVIRGIDTVTSN